MGSKTVTINPKPDGGTGKASLGIQSDVAFNEAAKRLCGRDLCSIGDLTVQEVAALMELSHAVKTNPDDFRHALDANVPLSTALTFLVNVAPQKNQVVIRYNVDAHNIAFDLQPDGLSHAEIECAAWIYTAKGKPVTFQTDFMRAGVKQEAISGIVQQGFPCDQSLNLAKGEYLMRLGVRDTNTGLFGTSNASVIVP